MSAYLETLYQQFKQNPESVEEQWRGYFTAIEEFDLSYIDENAEDQPTNGVTPAPILVPTTAPAIPMGQETVGEASTAQNNVSRLIQAYRYHGHRHAQTNPLSDEANPSPELALATFNLTESHREDVFATAGVLKESHAQLKDIITALKQTYCGPLALELGGIASLEHRVWLRSRLEATQSQPKFTQKQQEAIYDALYRANMFEKFLHNKFTGMKRFSIEGGDSLIPMLKTLIEDMGTAGMTDVVMGMAHRGRLNVLANILNKPLVEIFAAFMEKAKSADATSSGDVKYHAGRSADVKTKSGNEIHLSLLSNPSHLEAVNPVVTGSVRAKQARHDSLEIGRKKVLPLLIHGDSAFAGQGVVPETLNLANLSGYTVGGTLHVVINNQVGFTANPEETFSGQYCTDIARVLQCPIFHVNGDDPQACVYAMQLAFQFRQQFGQDVVIDLICYRRHGHNEGDDPSFTQPVMYQKIKQHPVPAVIYQQQAGLQTDTIEAAYNEELQKSYSVAEKGLTIKPDMFRNAWQGFTRTQEEEPDTKLPKIALTQLAASLETPPENFTPNRKVQKLMDQRATMLKGKEPMNWGAAELAAYGSLLREGYSVRLSGQDVRRGTFSHRHIGLIDAENGTVRYPVAEQAKDATLEVHNSCLSEMGVLGFEFGYSLAAPNTLTIWEAQFGDFANGAQIIIDQFIASTEVKWQRLSGLVMLLPHGFEGQGPEHSSARLERFLQLCGDDNMSVCMPTTPAQIAHLLRRQMLRKTRKPLIVMTPKSLLRHPKATSEVKDLTDGHFQPLIPDTLTKTKIKKIALCSGKIYYDLLAKREELNRNDVALIRIEELYPLPIDHIKKELKSYKTDTLVWVQEEPRNQGPWTHMQDLLWPSLGIPTPQCISRPRSASPAVGSAARHKIEQDDILNQVFSK